MWTNKYLITPFIILVFTLLSCEAQDMNVYQENQINELSIVKASSESLHVTVTPILESVYACPGITLDENDNEIKISFIRCHIDKSCQVDLKADLDPGNPGSYIINLPDKGKPIVVVYSSSQKQIWPKTSDNT
jgi:hypothetical protein